eukprot:CAMPEP_0115010812 /NCGR_PEP_ID=MMETSP0216-20121206/23563_1 /TAXON_ID=223996 /ORGANISM="Protocruzia adherens, Strain Boccale" /LENGTH=121 /DNA_ID=CAMNT_0002379147 /DNA_START=40 /DNA_END=405 /DNA_ORIENTATION=+
MDIYTILYYVFVFLVGLIYPAYKSLEVISPKTTPNSEDYNQWVFYWFIFIAFEYLFDFVQFIPLMGLVHCLVIAFLVLPKFRGSSKISKYLSDEEKMRAMGDKVKTKIANVTAGKKEEKTD